MAVTAAIIGGSALAGGLAGAFGSGDSTVTTETEINPAQDAALNALLSFAQPLSFDLSQQAGDFFGTQPFFQPQTQEQIDFIQQSQIAGSSALPSFSDLSSLIGGGQAGSFGGGLDAFSQFLQQSGNLSAGGGSDFATSGINPMLAALGLLGTDATGSSLTGLSDLAGRSGDIFGRAGDIGSIVNSFLDEDGIQAQIDAVSRDVTRNLTEDELPALARAGRFDVGNSNLGQQATLATSRTRDRLADISASIRGSERDRAFGVAQGLDQTGIQGALAALTSAGGLGATTALGANAAGTTAVQNQIDALRNLGTGAELGFTQGAQSLGTLGGAINTTLGGFGSIQGDQNAAIQAAINFFLTGQAAQLNPLQSFSSLIGPLVPTSTSVTTEGVGPLAGFFGGAVGGLGLGSSLAGAIPGGAAPAPVPPASSAEILRQLQGQFG